MSAPREYTVCFDATPLGATPDEVSGHTMRGIGRYIRGLMDAVVSAQPEWAAEHFRPVIERGTTAPPGARPIYARRPGFRRQDVRPWTAWAADRLGGASRAATLWHGLDPNAPLSPLPARRTLMTAYDLIPLHEPAAMAQIRRHRRLIYRLYLRRLKRARLVVAISETTAEDLRRTLGIPRERVHVVYPAVKVPAPAAAAGDDQAPADGAVRSASIEQPPDLLFVGVPDPTKQAGLAIEALAEIRRRGHRVILRFAGYHRASDRARLRAESAALGVSDAVDYLGRVEDARLAGLYRSSVLLAVSSIEGFGLPPVESLFAGGRVVAGTAAAYREALADAAVFATTADGPGLADAYEEAVGRPRTGAPTELVERYSPARVAAQLVAAYEDALAG